MPTTTTPTKIVLCLTLTLILTLTLTPTTLAQLTLDLPTSTPSTTPAPTSTPNQVIAAQATPSCSGGIVYDDGEADDALRLTEGDGTGVDGDIVQLFELGETDQLIEQVCVCWNRSGDPPATFLHELIFYADDNGAPGQELATVAAQIDSPPEYLTSTFFTYDTASLDIRNPTPNIFIGVRFFGGDQGQDGHVLCYDGDAPGDQPIFASFAGQESWISWQDLVAGSGADPDISLMVRADAAEEVVETCPATPCVEDATTLCLNDDRFRVTANWNTPNLNPPSGPAMAPAQELTPDTSYFWFFKDTNVEMVVKVLDACDAFDRYWVFAGGLTNVEVEMKVCDTQEGIQKTYSNPAQTPFQPIQDTDAFATCP